jgi:hypothetical protein
MQASDATERLYAPGAKYVEGEKILFNNQIVTVKAVRPG